VLFASALWALLPLVARTSLGRGPIAYGALVGSLGSEGCSALRSCRLAAPQSTDVITAVATVVFAVGCLALAWVREFGLLLCAMLVAGIGWAHRVSSSFSRRSGERPSGTGSGARVSTLTLFGSSRRALVWGSWRNEAGFLRR